MACALFLLARQGAAQQSHHPLLPREQSQPTTGLPASSFPTDVPSPLSTQGHVPRGQINPPILLHSILPRLPVVRPGNQCSHPPLTSPQVWSHFLLQTHHASPFPFPAPTEACCQHHTLTHSLSQKGRGPTLSLSSSTCQASAQQASGEILQSSGPQSRPDHTWPEPSVLTTPGEHVNYCGLISSVIQLMSASWPGGSSGPSLSWCLRSLSPVPGTWQACNNLCL